MLISIIIPIFNRACYLPRLFHSLKQQTYRPLEIILVDNNSTDTSFQLCQTFCNESWQNGFKVICLKEEKKGSCACRNTGLKAARGTYVYFFDSDDEFSQNFLEEAATLLPYADMICFPTVMVMPNGKLQQRATTYTTSVVDQIISAMLSSQSFLVKRQFILKCGGWNEHLMRWNDWELGIRLLLHSPQLHWIRGHSFHRIYQHQNSISGTNLQTDLPTLENSMAAAKQDLARAVLPFHEQRRAYNALISKGLLLASAVYREGAKTTAKNLSRRLFQTISSRSFRITATILYHLSRIGMRGTWRIYRLFL